MVKVFFFVLTFASGHQQHPIFAVASDCEVARSFTVRENPTATVTPCGTELVRK